MDFTLSEEQEMLRTSARDFLEDRCPKTLVPVLEGTAQVDPASCSYSGVLGAWALHPTAASGALKLGEDQLAALPAHRRHDTARLFNHGIAGVGLLQIEPASKIVKLESLAPAAAGANHAPQRSDRCRDHCTCPMSPRRVEYG